MAKTIVTTDGETPEVETPKPKAQAYKCVHPHGLHHNGNDYKAAQRYVFSEDDLREGGWLDSQVKAKLFESIE